MKKIDLHAHVAPEGSSSPMLSPEKLAIIYDTLGIEKGVLLPLITPFTKDMTADFVHSVSETFPERFFWFTTVDLYHTPPEDVLPYLTEEKARGAKGVGEISSKMMMDDSRVDNLFAACGRTGLPITFHIAASLDESYGVADDLGLPRLEKMLARHPETLVLGHAKPFWSEISLVTEENRRKSGKGPVEEGRVPELMRKYPNLLCDLSAKSGSSAIMRSDYGAKFLTEFQDRVFYGCDITSGREEHPKAFATHLTDLVKNGLISQGVYDKITRKNALRLLDEA